MQGASPAPQQPSPQQQPKQVTSQPSPQAARPPAAGGVALPPPNGALTSLEILNSIFPKQVKTQYLIHVHCMDVIVTTQCLELES